MAEKMSLSELQLVIRDSLYMTLPDSYWITAEISEMKENYAGHCYLDLVEKGGDDENIKARARAVIWSNRYRFIKSLFGNMTGENLRSGLKVLVKVRIEYHELYGLSLVISDIDPAYSAGEMAIKRQQIISRLTSEGVFDMNRDLPFPLVPQRIAIISSKGAAGYSDFMSHLNENAFGYRFHTVLFESAMQGTDTENGIINALDRIATFSGQFDVVAIIRGGGAQSDLGWFDNYNIAFHVTQFPIPVITGIGHEKDLSVTDMVACRSLKTPTAVADFIIDCTAEYENRISSLFSGIKEISLSIIEENRAQLESAGTRIGYSAKSLTASKSVVLAAYPRQFANASAFLTRRLGQKLESFSAALEILKPESALRRGYTLTTINGKLLKSSRETEEGATIDTHFVDGIVSSRVTGRKENENYKK